MKKPELCEKCESELGKWLLNAIFDIAEMAEKKKANQEEAEQ